MKIVSCGKSRVFSGAAAVGLLRLARESDGVIVLPLTWEEFISIESLIRKKWYVESVSLRLKDAIERRSSKMTVEDLASILIHEKRPVAPLLTKEDMRAGLIAHSRALSNIYSVQTTFQRAQAETRQALFELEAGRMLSVFERFRNQKPAIVIAEDNQATVLGRLFRVKVTRASKDGPRTKVLVRRTMKAIKRSLLAPVGSAKFLQRRSKIG